MLIIAILASHNGSNMQAIIDASRNGKLHVVPALVISNNSQSLSFQRAHNENIPTYHLSSHTHPNPFDLDQAMCNLLHQYSIDLVVLAGYMKKLGPNTLNQYKNKIINIHPALLPKYGGKGMYGLNVHKAVLNNHESFTGITVHIVDEEYDHGKIINQIQIPIPLECTAEKLQELVLSYEHQFYIDTIDLIATNKIEI
jgi:phosphoribosylglycinamide formyltransferase-1